MIRQVLKDILSCKTNKTNTILLIKEGTSITTGLFDDLNIQQLYFDNLENHIETLRKLIPNHDFALLDDDDASYFVDRAILSNIIGKEYLDVFEEYVNYCLTKVYFLKRQAITSGVKREFLKAFFDSNQVFAVKIASLHGENGLFFKSFCNDIRINTDAKYNKDSRITILLNTSKGHTQLPMQIENLYSVLFFKTVMAKAWRAECFHNLKPVLREKNIFKEIKILDEGETSVIFSDADGHHEYTCFLKDYKAYFPASVPHNKIHIELSQNGDMIEQACFLLLKYYNESIPFIDDTGIKGYIKKRSEQRFSLDLCWELIDDEVLRSLLKQFNNVLFSSDQEDLMILCDKIKKWKKADVLNDDNFVNMLDGKYDLIISNCDIWDNIPANYIHLKHLYINAYCAQIKKFFDANNIEYHFIGIPDANRIVNHAKRVANESKQLVNNIIRDNGTYTVADGTIDDCVYFHGRRRTTDIPLIWHKTIYFYGPCISIGVFAHDNETIESYLQRKLNEAGLPYRVVNVPAPLLLNPYDSAINTLHKIGMEKYRKGDIVVHFGRQFLEWEGIAKENVKKHDLTLLFNNSENVTKKCFIGHMGAHMNSTGYQIVANYIFDIINDSRATNVQKSAYCQFHPEQTQFMQEGLNAYVRFLQENKFTHKPNDIIGSVAVNANPFTLGHAHLIQSALKLSDYLYVFVAEEDLSDFSFEDRFTLVKNYCKSYNNIRVFPSGRFFASTISFGDYFNRDALKTVKIDASLDCNIFSTVIAKELDISFRMLGEEKNDDVTRQYNDFVKEILEQNGIEVKIIPRCQVDGKAISAKQVRKDIAEGNYDNLKKEVPKSTFDFIISRLGQSCKP